MSAKLSYFLTPSPRVTVTNQLILFLSSAFWGPPPTADVAYGSPQAEVPSYLVTLDGVALVRAEGDVDEGLPP